MLLIGLHAKGGHAKSVFSCNFSFLQLTYFQESSFHISDLCPKSGYHMDNQPSIIPTNHPWMVREMGTRGLVGVK